MSRLAPLPAVLALLLLPTFAHAQPAEPPPMATVPAEVVETPPPPVTAVTQPPTVGVDVITLSAPDAFSVAGRETGLPSGLWRGAPAATVQAALQAVASKPLSPATAALARRVLATGAPGPAGAETDQDLAGLRASALLALGDVKAAGAILERAPGVDRSSGLSRAAAESALLAGDDTRACATAQALSVGRDDIYWLRLRTYCQALAGEMRAAHLTFDLAQTQAKDPVFARLMGAKLAGAGAPGAPSARNGLDYALSRSLGLDMAAAKSSPGVAAALGGGDPVAPTWDIPAGDFAAAAGALASGAAVPAEEIARLIDGATVAGDPKARARKEGAALLAAATAPTLTPEARAGLATFTLAGGKAPAGRALALTLAGEGKRMGEAAMLAVWISADAGADGPAPGDRAAIVRALTAVGLEAEARMFALEGLAALK